MSIRRLIEQKLVAGLSPLAVEIVDESRLHAGHAGQRQTAEGVTGAAATGRQDPPSGETHFRITIISSKFIGLSLLERQRLVYSLLKEEIGNPIHALSLKTLTPDEKP